MTAQPYAAAAALRQQAVPLTPGSPAYKYLLRRGIPADVIAANAGDLLHLSANIPGRPPGEHALVALVRDAGSGDEVAFQLSFCDIQGGRVPRTKDNPDKRSRLLKRKGSLTGLFLAKAADRKGRAGTLCLVEGRSEKALAISAAGYDAAGFGGRQVLGRQALPAGVEKVIVVHDKRPVVSTGPSMLAEAAKADQHDTDYAHGAARLEMVAGLKILEAKLTCPAGASCKGACKDADDYARAHGVDALRAAIEAAEPVQKTVAGEALKISLISDRAKRDQALRAAAKALGVGITALKDAVERLRRTTARKQREDEAATAVPGLTTRQEPFVLVHCEYKTKNGRTLAPGVYFESVDDDGNTTLTWVCSKLEVIGKNRDTASEAWGILLRVTDADGVLHEWPMPASLLAGRGDEMRGELLDLGLQISTVGKARDRLAEYIQQWKTDDRYRCVDRLGWHGETFVLPKQTFGGSAFDEEVLFQHRHARDIPKFEQAGTLDGWQAEVAAPAVGNSRLVFALSAAFAGPLVRLVGEESGGFHFFGPSSVGKTTALRCACSIWGVDDKQWRASDNALEVVAACACDGLLPLDETGQAAPRVLAAAAYMLANQSGKSRMSRGGNRNRPTLSWVLLFLSTGEHPLSTQLAQAGITAQAGQQVRMVELPGDAGAGLGLYEVLHGSPNPNDFALRLQEAARQHRGHAAPLFLEHLAANRPQAVAAVKATATEWLEKCLPAGASGQVTRVAGRFALVAAAGELATIWGAVPWPVGTASAAAAVCFRAWLAHRGGTGPAEIREGVAAVRLFLEQFGASRFEPAWTPREDRRPPDPFIYQRAGFRKRADVPAGTLGITASVQQPWEYYVLPEVWRCEVCKGFDPKAIAKAMVAEGSMLAGDGRNITRSVRIPGIGMQRVICILASAFAENVSEQSVQSEQRGNPRASAAPTQKPDVGAVGAQPENPAQCSDCSDMASGCRSTENPNEINDVPTAPTAPTRFDTKHGRESSSSANGAAAGGTCMDCGTDVAKPARGPTPKRCPVCIAQRRRPPTRPGVVMT